VAAAGAWARGGISGPRTVKAPLPPAPRRRHARPTAPRNQHTGPSHRVKNLNFTKYALKNKQKKNKIKKRNQKNHTKATKPRLEPRGTAPSPQPAQPPLTGVPPRQGQGWSKGEATAGPTSTELPPAPAPSPAVGPPHRPPKPQLGWPVMARGDEGTRTPALGQCQGQICASQGSDAHSKTPGQGHGSPHPKTAPGQGPAAHPVQAAEPPTAAAQPPTPLGAPRPRGQALPQPGRSRRVPPAPGETTQANPAPKAARVSGAARAREYLASRLLFNQHKKREIFIVSECIKVALGFVRDADITKHFIWSLPTVWRELCWGGKSKIIIIHFL